MKTSLASLALVLALALGVVAQTAPTVEEQLTTLWKQKNYTELRNLLDAKTSATPPDVVALYCAKFFYLVVQPDKAKALAAATKLKAAAQATTNADFIAFADGELAEVQGIPDAEFVQSPPELLATFHAESPNQYPTVEVGARLRKYKNP
jgi:hypothetical protein